MLIQVMIQGEAFLMHRFMEVSSTNWILSDVSLLMLKSCLIYYLIRVCLMTRMCFHKIWCSPASLPANQKKWSFSYLSQKNKKMWSFKRHIPKQKKQQSTQTLNTPNPSLKQSQLSPPSLQSSSKTPLLSRQPATKVFNPRKPNSAFHWSFSPTLMK